MLDTKLQEALQDVSFKIDVRDIQGIPSTMGNNCKHLRKWCYG